ncbi:MAG: DUF4097 family beta strand repeat-containing protein [Clostridium sp.]
MNKVLKTSLAMILVGFILAAIGLLAGGRISSISLNKEGVKVYDSDRSKNVVKESFDLDKFNKIDISSYSNLSYIQIVKGEDYKLDLQHDEEDKINYSVKDGVLTINDSSKEDKAIHIGFYYNNAEQGIKLYVPEDCNLDELKIYASSSDVKITEVDCKDIDINNEYGDVELSDISCEDLVLKLESGDLNLTNIESKKISFENEYGSVKVKDVNGEELSCVIDSGDFNGENLSISKNYNIESYYGSIDIKKSDFGNFKATLSSGDFDSDSINISQDCDIKNEYGSVNMENSSLGNFTANLESGDIKLSNITSLKDVDIRNSYGDVELSGKIDKNSFNYYLKCEDGYGTIDFNDKEYEGNFNKDNNAKYTINITVESGDIDLKF